ncbi:cytochrome b/b6 domain-containing protein [Ferruginivarius sediminum]|uniref:Cytochrome B n=1 Tax=Ferruginivarius sediminum TaxID=2661937 RepID=A0A369TLW6_9PROT|nr:cytochrome b/b6 domain-containing protein [Ferruginivarius sediminum]RDD63916.1 cytochrome B [Ferruginivarius sediminum]
MRRVVVWDLPTRVFHWALVALVALAYVTAEDDGLAYQVHVLCGYGVALLLAFRVLWGFVGSRHARFADFIYGWSMVRDYVRGLLRLDPPHHVGHNPLGAIMIFALLAVLIGTVWTGLASGGGESDLHETLGNLVIILAAIHVAGVLADWLLTGENLTRAMVTGWKELPDAEASRETPPVRPWRAVAVALVVAVLAYEFVAYSQLVTWPPAHSEGEYGEDEE